MHYLNKKLRADDVRMPQGFPRSFDVSHEGGLKRAIIVYGEWWGGH